MIRLKHSSRSPLLVALLGVGALASTLLTGCGIGLPAGPAGTTIQSMSGAVHGGQAPIQGSTVTLYHTNPAATTYGAVGIIIGSATSDANGNFVIAPSATSSNCPAGTQTYITAAGGYQSGQPTLANSQMLLVAALGECSTISSATIVNINEVTTVGAAYALSGFSTTSVTAGLPVANVSAPVANSSLAGAATSTAPSGLAHAFTNSANLVNTTAGLPNTAVAASSNGTTVTGNVPNVELLTLADMMQACVDSRSSITTPSTNCTTLFNFTPSISGVIPTNTFQAFVNLARNPYPSAAAMNLSTGLLSLVSSTSAFQPTLTAAPIDWSVSIVYGHGTLPLGYFTSTDANDTFYFGLSTPSLSTPALYGVNPYGVAVPSFASPSALASTPGTRFVAPDALGNIWAANNSFVTDRFSTSTGALLSSYTSTVGSTFAVAVDKANNLWISHVASGTGINIEGLVYTPGTPATWPLGYTASPGTNTGPYGIAVDANQNIVASDYYNAGTTVSIIPNSGTVAAPVYAGTTTTGVTAVTSYIATVGNKPYSTVFDASGTLWTGISGATNSLANTGIVPVTLNSALSSTSATAGTFIPGSTAGANGNTLGTLAVQEMAIDGAGTIFIPDNNASTQGIHMYSTVSSNTLTPSTGLKSCYLATSTTTACGVTTGAAVYNPRQPAIDSTGSVWAGETGGGVVQIIGVAAPSYPLLSVGKPGISPGLTAVNPLP